MNPIPYNQLFDIDGLKMAIKDTEAASDAFGKSSEEDFKRTRSAAAALRKELEAINATLANSKPIKLSDDTGKEQVRNYAKQVSDLTAQIKTQEAAIASLNRMLTENKQAIMASKAAEAQYRADLQAGRVATEQQRTAIANVTLQMRQLALANRQASQSQTAANGSYKEAQQRLTALGNSIKNAENGFKNTSPAIKAQIKEYNELNDKLKAFDAQMGNHQRNVGNYKSALGDLTGQLKGLVVGYLSVQGALQLAMASFDANLKLDSTRASLEFTLGTVDAAKAKLDDLRETAIRLGLDFTPLAETYAKFAGAAKASNFPLAEADRIFKSVAGAAARFHLSSDQLSGALLALQQMISKGNVQAEELRGQLGERLPGAFAIAARALGVTEKELNKLLQTGQVTANELLPKLATELDKTFSLDASTRIDSLTASTNRLKTTFDNAIQGDGIGRFFKQIVEGATNAIAAFDRLLKSRSFGEVTARLFGGYQTYDQKNAVEDNFSSSRDFARKNNINTAGSPKSAVFADLASKPLEDLEKLRQGFLKAGKEAATAVNVYKRGIASGDLTDGGKNSLAEVEGNFKAIQDGYGMVNAAYQKVLAQQPKARAAAKELADDQLTSIAAIRKRIAELSKLDGSATEGSPVNNRIDALKKRLHDLTATTKQVKDGFALLEQQLNKVATQLQDAIIQDYAAHQGKESAQTRKLATEYQNLTEKLNALKKAKDEALLNVARQSQIQQFGSVFPTAQRGTAPTITNTKEFQIADNTNALSGLDDELSDSVIKYAKANQEILNQFKQRNITKEQYDKEMLRSESNQATEEYNIRKQILAKEVDNERLIHGETSKQYRRLKEQQAKLDEEYSKKHVAFTKQERDDIIAIYDSIFSAVEKNNETIGKIFGQNVGNLFSDLTKGLKDVSTASALGESLSFGEKFQLASQVAMDATGAYTDFAISASQKRQAALESEMQYEIDGAGNNAEAKKRIEAEYTKRINAERTKQAKLQKAAAATEIIINTAIAVSKVFGQTGIFGIGLAPIVAALGAVQLGLVLAQPLPQYEKGRDGGKAEFAEVNERGAELIGQRGAYRIANGGKRGVTYLNKGDKVITADKTQKILENQIHNADEVGRSKAIYDSYVMSGGVSIDYDKMGLAMADAASRVPGTINHWDERGFTRYQRKSNSRILDVRKRNSL